MPYIPTNDRPQYQNAINELSALIPKDRMARPGHINYIVSLLLERTYGKQLRYADINEIVGTLNCICMEFYAMKARPYEDLKIQSEGDLGVLP